MSIYEMLEYEDLTPDLQMIEDICGRDTVVKLMKGLCGLNFYIPKLSHLETLVYKYIRANPNKNYKQMARDIHVSEPFLKKVDRKFRC